MSRSGYSDDYDNLQLYRQAVERATKGYRGQHLLKKLRDALDAMPVKRLITGQIKSEAGDVCALGALDPNVNLDDADDLAPHFNIARSLAAGIVYVNDEYYDDMMRWKHGSVETPEERWVRMRKWVDEQIEPDAQE